MKHTKWFERKFPIIEDDGMLPNLLERLEGTGPRLHSKIQRIDVKQLKPIGDQWSIKKHIGHLIDLEPLWLERAHQIINNEPQLTAADLTNKKTNEANHDERNAIDLVEEFARCRQRLVNLLRNVTVEDLSRASVHPRLGTPMKVADLAYFIAEHDDHHLASINFLSQTRTK